MELDIARATGEGDRRPPPSLLIDCDTCQVRGDACADCVVSCLLGGPPEPVHLDSDEIDALGALAGLGLLPPLRLITAVSSPDPLIEELPTEEAPTDGC
jgi:hypothetical protein